MNMINIFWKPGFVSLFYQQCGLWLSRGAAWQRVKAMPTMVLILDHVATAMGLIDLHYQSLRAQGRHNVLLWTVFFFHAVMFNLWRSSFLRGVRAAVIFPWLLVVRLFSKCENVFSRCVQYSRERLQRSLTLCRAAYQSQQKNTGWQWLQYNLQMGVLSVLKIVCVGIEAVQMWLRNCVWISTPGIQVTVQSQWVSKEKGFGASVIDVIWRGVKQGAELVCQTMISEWMFSGLAKKLLDKLLPETFFSWYLHMPWFLYGVPSSNLITILLLGLEQGLQSISAEYIYYATQTQWFFLSLAVPAMIYFISGVLLEDSRQFFSDWFKGPYFDTPVLANNQQVRLGDRLEELFLAEASEDEADDCSQSYPSRLSFFSLDSWGLSNPFLKKD